MLLRLILLAALIAVGWYAYRRYLRSPARREQIDKPVYQPMVACRRCGVHLPTEQALIWRGAAYCCREHLPDDETAA
ncbi:MAG: hypothetical protein L0H19_04175 [Salinisphaera sp.]|nr:hypothetical protein [Salinisphaera sp.]MDN5938411.1 hypothetical protein [Salinisphaera sp.]